VRGKPIRAAGLVLFGRASKAQLSARFLSAAQRLRPNVRCLLRRTQQNMLPSK
jgi:hypothetical protein